MFKHLKKIIIFIFILTTALFAAHFALAQSSDNLLFGGLQNETGNIIGLGDEDPRIIIANIIRVALGFLGIVAVGLVMYAGWIWMTADGNAENIEKAKKILTGAVIGLVIILLSFAIASYILGKLLDATGGGVGEACDNNGGMRPCGCGGAQTCMSGTWGACVGSTCGSGTSPFYITSTYPSNGAANIIRNAKIRFSFYSSIDSGTVSLEAGGTFRVTDSDGVEIAGSQITEGRRISFTPSGACPENPCNAASCLPENEAITVTAVNGASGILSAGGKEIDCSSFGTLPCSITFNTGELIDCEDPKVSLDFDQICIAPDNKIYADSSDDSGVDSIEFFINNSSTPNVPEGNNPIVNSNDDKKNFKTRAEFLPSIWDGSGYAVGESINIKATANDVDDHSASDSKNVILRPAHCCDDVPIPNGDETGVNCGGSCAACDGAQCDLGDDNPATCITPEDSICASGFCDTNSCTCVSQPIIDWVSPAGGFCNQSQDIFCGSNNSICDQIIAGDTCNPDAPNGAVGNLVTIGGRYFGSTQGSGSVTFDDGTNPPITAALAGCAGSWKDRSIVIKVPAGLTMGPGTAITVKANNGFFNTTDNNFVINNLVRPGICAINPEQGYIGEEITYEGARLLNNQGYFGNMNSASLAESVFGSDISGTAEVPNIKTGESTTFTRSSAEGANSNFLPFTKKAELKTGPQITSFSPTSGKEGQYITISGSGFGSADKSQIGVSHHAYFDLDVSNNNTPENYGVEVNYDFPEICSDSLWKDNQIIIKVPTGLENDRDYFIVVNAVSWNASISTDGLIPNETFKYNNSLPLLPSLCKIAPAMGPNNSNVSLWGEYFGAGATAQVKFQLNKTQGPPLTITENGGADRINTTVPGAAISGPVSVIQGSNEGNSLNFSVGNCSNENDCGGTVCCPAGSFRAGMCAVDDTGLGGNGDGSTNVDDCYADIGSSVYEWDFNTGSGGNIGDPCKTDPQTGACDINNSGCSPDLICDPTDCTCQPAGTCAGYSMNECTEGPLCPNSPGACQALNETIAANACDNNYCNSEYPQCAGACSYNENLCVSASTCDGENASLISGYTAVCEKVSGTTGKWQINISGASCPVGTFLDTNGRCTVGTVGNPTACSVCADGLSCDNGQCVVNEKVCADGFNCDAGICTKEKDSCECCCRVAEEDADCCLGLTCTPNLCGGDDPNYGQCTGCTIEVGSVPDQTLSNAACNCDGVTNKVCNINFDADSDGIKEGKCEDALAPGASCDSDPSTPECTPDGSCETGLFCDGNNGCVCNPIVVGTDCDNDPVTDECNIIPNFCESAGLICDPDGGDDAVGSADDCTCQQSGNDVGESCDDLDNPPACNPSACKSGLSCMTETWPPVPGNCGNCCCSVGTGDNCNLINPNLVCNYAEDAGGCFDNNKGVAPDFGLCCGCSSDSQCGGDVSATGCGSDTCCRPRPNIINEEEGNNVNGCKDLVNAGDGIFESCPNDPQPFNKSENVCRNAAIEVSFDKKMDIKSFSGNVVVVGDYGFGVCPEGTEYILAENENKGFFAKLFSAPLRFVKKIFYLLNPEARALTVNFCAIPGKVSGRHNVDETTTLSFSPDGLFDGNRKYYAIIKGDSNIGDNIDEGVKDIYGVSMVDVWPDIDGSGLSESDRTFNGTVYHGYAWSFETMSALSVNNGVCKIDHVIVSPKSYLFSTIEDDVKENDADSESSDFDKKQDRDKVFSADAVSADGQPLTKISGIYEWSWEWTSQPSMVVNFDSENPFAATDAKQLFAAQTGVTDGKAVITATANVSGSMAGDSEFYSAGADVWVFICENPWPAIDSVTGLWTPWTDAQANCGAFAGGQCPNTNYNIYYCRDAAGVGTIDDLPAILSKSTIIRGKSTDNKILKEFYFFREAAPAVSDGMNLEATNISTTTDGTVALSWSAPAGGADGYKIYYGTNSGNYDFYIDVGDILSKEIGGLTLDKNYYFSVTAYFDTGAESGYSSEVSIEVKDLTAPKPPTSLNLEKACDGEAVISWNKNTEDAAGYKVYYGSTQSGQYGSSADVKDANSATLKGLNNGTKYYLAVNTYDESGNESLYSDEVAFTVIDSSGGTCFNPNDGLVLWQTFDSVDISGNIAKDKSGKGNDGIIYGAISAVGKVGQAMNFDGTNDYVQMADSDELDITSDFTVSMWVKRGRNSYINVEDIYSKNGPQTTGALTIDIRPNNKLGVVVQNIKVVAYSTTPITDQNWHHIVLTRASNNDWIFYLDGNEDGITNDASVPTANDKALNIGGEFPPTQHPPVEWPYKGSMDEVRLYDKALSATYIKALYEQSLNTSVWSSVVSLWKFDEGAGFIAHDSAGNNDGVLSSGAFWDNNGRTGKAVKFNGAAGSYIDCGNDPSLTLTDEITISYWFKRYGGNYTGYTEDRIRKNGSYIITGQNDDSLIAYIKNNPIYLNEGLSFGDGVWVHEVHTYNAVTGIGKAYKDGNFVGQKIYNTGLPPYKIDVSAAHLIISHPDIYAANGSIDEVIIFNKALSDVEANYLYKSY